MFKKIFLSLLGVAIVAAVVFFLVNDGAAKRDEGPQTFEVKRDTIIDKALAVGRIEPENENIVKSKIPGLVRRIFVDVGDKVKVGDSLFDIAPDPTPLEFAEAKRQVELAQVAFDNVSREFERSKSLKDKQLISNQEYESKQAEYEEAELRLKLAKEKLALIESGHTKVADLAIDNIIKSTVNGTVLSIDVEEGDPVVPLTTFQAGTPLMSLAQMETLVFKGNVDEIDVGKLSENMAAEIEIGAIPNSKISGIVRKISPKAHKDEGATMFEIEIEITESGEHFLRAGYSANANIIITKKEGILAIPERLVTMEDSTATVEVQDSLGVIASREVKTGLSDGINIEIIEGLDEGELVVERPPREITAD
jgi:HlyD family secretion protein